MLDIFVPHDLNIEFHNKKIKIFLETTQFSQYEKIFYLESFISDLDNKLSQEGTSAVLNFIDNFDYSDEKSVSFLMEFLPTIVQTKNELYNIAGNLYLDYILATQKQKSSLVENPKLISKIFYSLILNNKNPALSKDLYSKIKKFGKNKTIKDIRYIYEVKNNLRPFFMDQIIDKNFIKRILGKTAILDFISTTNISNIEKIETLLRIKSKKGVGLKDYEEHILLYDISVQLNKIPLAIKDKDAYEKISDFYIKEFLLQLHRKNIINFHLKVLLGNIVTFVKNNGDRTNLIQQIINIFIQMEVSTDQKNIYLTNFIDEFKKHNLPSD